MATRLSPRLINLTEFDSIQREAESLIASFRGKYGYPAAPPVPVGLIARTELGLQCEVRRLGEGDSRELGTLCAQERLVLVDGRCTRHQYLFTSAPVVAGSQRAPLSQLLCNTNARTREERDMLREVEANRFAAALLMPRDFLSDEAKKHGVLDQSAVARLARAFDVSISAMLVRIKDLSQHLHWTGPGIDWDALRRLELILDVARRTGGQIPLEATSESRSDERGKSDVRMQHEQPRQARLPRRSEAVQAFEYLRRFSEGDSSGQLFDRGDTAASLDTVAEALGDYFRRLRWAIPPEREQDRTAPLIIEFAGTPNSGKDTLIEIIKDYLEDGHGYRVRVCDEAIKFCHIQKQLRVDRLFKTVAQTVAQLYEARFENPGDYDVVIFNRGLFDRLAFLRAMRVLGEISQEKERIHSDYLLSYAGLEDIAFLFLISEEESISRERENGRSSVQELYTQRDGKAESDLRAQRILHRKMLVRLNESYLHTFGTCKEAFDDQIYLFDFTGGGDASIIEKACALADATLPRDSSHQLVIPGLFGLRYACRRAAGSRRQVENQSSSEKLGPEATQLLLFKDGIAHQGAVL